MFYNGNSKETLLLITDRPPSNRIKVDISKCIIYVPVNKLKNPTALGLELRARSFNALLIDAVLDEKQSKNFMEVFTKYLHPKIKMCNTK